MAYTPTKIIVPEHSGDRVQTVENFLSKHYEIKINIFDPSKSIIVAKDKTLYEQEPNEMLISLHMERENIRGCDTILRKIIRSGYHINTFNPILDYIKSLEGQWKGDSHIEKFCKYITVRNFEDKEDPEYYQERFKRIIKKWMAASIACSLGIKENDVMIGFVHPKEGIGKTRILKFLTPQPLKAYYVESNKDSRYFNVTSAFSQNFIINFDEFNGITKNSAEQVKNLLSNTEYRLSLRDTNAVPRMGNGAFTSNKNKELGGFLFPTTMGYRRWATIELDTINWKKYSVEIDVDQMWAEAYVLFKNSDFDYIWNDTDFEEFKEYNARYVKESEVYTLINKNFRIPELGEESVNKQPKEILQELNRVKKITSDMKNVSEVTIGMALSSLGFEHKMKKVNGQPRYGYEVVQLFE